MSRPPAASPQTNQAQDLRALAASPELGRLLQEHAQRGIRIQLLLRNVLAGFVLLVAVTIPPIYNRDAFQLAAVGYLVWAVGLTVLARRRQALAVRSIWTALFVDMLVLATLAVLAAASDQQTWTTDALLNGFFLLPLLSATQLRPWICVAVGLPTIAVYLTSSMVAKSADGDPWSVLLLRTGVLAGIVVGSGLLSRLQRLRVLTIGALAAERTRLLAETEMIEERERRDLADHLHDGALQYVLAARQDLEDARDNGNHDDHAAFDRIDEALRQSSLLLRTTMSGLHPAVLEQAGLRHAIHDMAAALAQRGRIKISAHTDQWPTDFQTPHDQLLYVAARELLTNVVKHAHATHADVSLTSTDTTALLVVSDNGCGMTESDPDQKLKEGHLGLASRRARIEAAGGQLLIASQPPHGTTATVTVPL